MGCHRSRPVDRRHASWSCQPVLAAVEPTTAWISSSLLSSHVRLSLRLPQVRWQPPIFRPPTFFPLPVFNAYTAIVFNGAALPSCASTNIDVHTQEAELSILPIFVNL